MEMDLTFADEDTKLAEMIDRALRRVNTAMPGVIESFDPATQTANVIPAIQAQVNINDKISVKDFPPIIKVPLVFPFASTKGFALTLPVARGDPCLIIFSQRPMDRWFEFGGIQSPEGAISCRHHHLTDAFAILSPSPLPGVLGDWQTDAIEIRDRDRTNCVSLTATGITVTGLNITVTGSENVNISGNGNTVIEGKNFLQHKHGGVEPGGGSTGGVN